MWAVHNPSVLVTNHTNADSVTYLIDSCLCLKCWSNIFNMANSDKEWKMVRKRKTKRINDRFKSSEFERLN